MNDASRDAASLLRDFVNTLDVETRIDQIETPGRLDAWLREHALVPALTAPAPGTGRASGAAGATDADLALARDLREGLRTAMLGHHGPSAPLMPRSLEDAFAALPLRVTLSDGHPRLIPADHRSNQDVRAGLAHVAAAVMEAVADGTWARLKVCQESTCRWAFLDTSKNRSRAWCSMRVCGNRTKTRAYRARMRTTEETAEGTTRETAGETTQEAAGERSAEH
ncbi:CGNR zinc finger domain-containing protein [Actinomadura gamaensis]|uniref:CGNR zinc finger domain-containing protein n=1 Tax=Actinomadura gamaensis TaxID=1763541 RepID=A0ABV9TQR6_9ACTN